MKKLCCIFGAGEYYGNESLPDKPFFAVSADGGYTHAIRLGVKPDIHTGDFDSADPQIDAGTRVVRLKPEKADTDTSAAVKLALSEGCDSFIFYGCTGGRTAHTMANIQTLVYLAGLGIRAHMIGDREIFTCIKDGAVCFEKSSSGYISVFSLSENSTGVYERGLKYPLTDSVLTADCPLGVSNEFIGEEAEISVKHGTLLIIYTDRAAERREQE